MKRRVLAFLTLCAAAVLAAPTARGTYKLEVQPSSAGQPAAVSVTHAIAMKSNASVKIYLFSQAGQSDPQKADLTVTLLPAGPLEKPSGFTAGELSYPKRGVLLNYYNPSPVPATAKGYSVSSKTGKLLISDWKFEGGLLRCGLNLEDVKPMTSAMALRHSLNCRVDAVLK